MRRPIINDGPAVCEWVVFSGIGYVTRDAPPKEVLRCSSMALRGRDMR